MKTSRLLRTICIAWMTLGLILQGSGLYAGSPIGTPTFTSSAQQPLPPTVDLALGPGGRLQGLVVDVQGVPVAAAPVVVRQWQGDITVATSDRLGQFAVQGLRGGTYQLLVGQQRLIVRAWTTEAAPPQARSMVLIVVNDPLVRGQLPLQDYFASDAFVVAGLVAASIAIPILTRNSDHGQPQSP
jgi:hypothetical protein